MKQFVTLDKLAPGARGTVRALKCGNPHLRNKLLSLGIVPGRILEVSHFAPLGDPMTVKCTGFSLALRLSEARCIDVIPS